MISNFGQSRPTTTELPALECLEKSPLTDNGRNDVATLATSFLIGPSSFLRVTRTCINALMSSTYNQIAHLTREFAALERLKSMYNDVATLVPLFFVGFTV